MVKKTEKKISINTLKKVIKERTLPPTVYTIKVDDEDLEIKFDPCLSIEEYVQLINDIVAGCVTLGEYVPALKEISIISQVLARCSNISIDNISVLHDFVRHLSEDVVEDMMEEFENYYPDFLTTVDEAIDFEVQKYLHTSSFDLIANKIVSILNTLESQLQGVSGEDIAKLTEFAAKFANKDEAKIAKAVLQFQKDKENK